MFARKVLVLLLAISVAAFAMGCGGKKAIEPVAEPEVAPPMEKAVEKKVTPPVIKEVPAPSLNPIFFAFDQHNLSAEAKSTLDANAKELKRAGESMVIIEGHCDERGTKSYNLGLGEKRANAARNYLLAQGINASRVTVVSYGKERPFDAGHTEAAWAKNRRAHFVMKK